MKEDEFESLTFSCFACNETSHWGNKFPRKKQKEASTMENTSLLGAPPSSPLSNIVYTEKEPVGLLVDVVQLDKPCQVFEGVPLLIEGKYIISHQLLLVGII